MFRRPCRGGWSFLPPTGGSCHRLISFGRLKSLARRSAGSFRRSSGAPAGAIGFPFPFRPGGYAPLHHRLISGLPSGDFHPPFGGTFIPPQGDSHHPSGDSHPSLWGLSSPPPGTLITPSGDSHHPLWGLSSSSPGGRREISRWREPPVPDENHNAARQGRRTEKSRRRRTNVQVAMRQCCRRHPLAVLTASLVSRLSSALSPRGRPRLSQRRQGWLPSPGRSQPALPGSGKPDAP